jgi:hypothetical protein
VVGRVKGAGGSGPLLPVRARPGPGPAVRARPGPGPVWVQLLMVRLVTSQWLEPATLLSVLVKVTADAFRGQ